MDLVIKPLHPSMPRPAGVAVTVKAPPGDNWAAFGGLARAFAGAVLVVDWGGHTGSCGGGEKALLPGIARGFPVFGRATTPFSPAKRDAGEVCVPVSCGGVVVEPGDVVVGDADEVAVVPRRHVHHVARAPASSRTTADARDEDMVARIGAALERGFGGHGGDG